MPVTPNMDLLLPVPTVTFGPTYASENNDAFTLVDSHDHTMGKGVPIPSAAININNDLSFNDFNGTAFRAVRFTSQGAVLTDPTDINELYVVSGNLFYNNQLGQPVQITSGAAIDATSIGGIGGDYATSTALVFYTSADKTFTFWSNTNTPASIDAGPITFRNDTLNSPGITFAPNNTIASDYQVTWPATLPSSTEGVTIDPAGNISYTGGTVPSGMMGIWPSAVIPSGWLLCDGSAISRTTFAAIFAVVGTAYGIGDGSTTFNLPQGQGMFLRGTDNGAGNDPDASSRPATNGGNSGDNVGSSQVSQLALHIHNITIFEAQALPVATTIGTGNPTLPVSGGGAFTNAAGGSTETRPINIYVNYIIKI